MRITVKADSASPEQVYDLTRAFQRTRRDHEMPRQITDEPTVTVAGAAMGWESPALLPEHARTLLSSYEDLQAERGLVGDDDEHPNETGWTGR